MVTYEKLMPMSMPAIQPLGNRRLIYWPYQWILAPSSANGFMVSGGIRRMAIVSVSIAHRLHHRQNGKEGGVSFGFLYAPKAYTDQASWPSLEKHS
jgi:hypothetical protein